jgi:hypothetical protein
MQFSSTLRIAAVIAAGISLQGQPPATRDAPSEAKGIPPRAAPSDYLTHAQAGAVTIAAEFTGHAVPTAEGPLSTEDYVGVEVAFFGPAGARTTLSSEDFSLRVNGKKTPVPSVPYGMVFASLKDPEWEPPASETTKKSKTSVGGGGQGESNEPPPPVKIPVEVRRAMSQRVQKAALPGGDRALPQAGLIFFQYRGKTTGIHSLELVYSGPAGKATLALQP